MSILLRADLMISEGLTTDHCFFGVSGMIAGFLELYVMVSRFAVYSDS